MELSSLNLWFHPREFLQTLRRLRQQLLSGHNPWRLAKSVHRLATFYHRFIKNFSVIVTPITDCLKNEKFQWAPAAAKAFKEVKKVDDWSCCHTSTRFFKGVWSNIRHIRTCDRWCAKLEKSPHCLFQREIKWRRQRHSTYGLAIGGVLSKKFYAIVQALRYWRYLLPHEVVQYLDHDAPEYLNSQKRLNARHSKWVKFLQDYTFALRTRSLMRSADEWWYW